MKPSMKQRTLQMTIRKRIALIAHDNRKFDLLEWARYNEGTLEKIEFPVIVSDQSDPFTDSHLQGALFH